MANRNTYVPTNTRVKARRIRKVMKAILPAHPESDAEGAEMERDMQFLTIRLRNYDIEFLDVLGDNHTIDFGSWIDEFKELEDKYIKAPKEALKGL